MIVAMILAFNGGPIAFAWITSLIVEHMSESDWKKRNS
jgi:predicted outer membrane lipoprotein